MSSLSIVKKAVAFVGSAIFFLHAQAQSDSLQKTVIRSSGQKMATAFIQKDYETLCRYTYPKIVQAMGGEKKMIANIKENMRQMSEKGMVMQSASIGDISRIVHAGKEWHCLVQEQLLIGVPGGTLNALSYLLGVSDDGGRTWTFVDTAPMNKENIFKLFPNYNQELVLPEKQKPVFIPSH